MPILRAHRPEHYQAFIDHMPNPFMDRAYLTQARTYVMLLRGEVIGGYVLNDAAPCITPRLVPHPDLQAQVQALMEKHHMTEVTLLWIKPKYRKTWRSKLLSLSIGWRCLFIPSRYVIFTTVIRTLQHWMRFPSSSMEIWKGEPVPEMGSKLISFFVAEGRHALIGIALARFLGPIRKRGMRKRHGLERMALVTPKEVLD